MELIDEFTKSKEDTKNLGMQDYLSRKKINEYCHDNNLHTLSIDLEDSLEFGSDTIKELHVSKIPFKITDPLLEKSIVNEINFVLDTKQYTTLNDLLMNSNEERRAKINRFLEQFSFIYSNNYTRLFEHRKYVVNIARKDLTKIQLPELTNFEPIKSPHKTVFTIGNHGKSFIRFDMINAVTSVIGIRDWKSFISKYTKLDLYISSKSLRGYIMCNIHKYCMKLVEQHIVNFINLIPSHYKETYLVINCDEIILNFDPDNDYEQLMKEVDPDNYFRTQIFNLKYVEDDKGSRFIETHQDGTERIKCPRYK